ncbi:hypothetical protein BG006_001834, partial [Podila minutissima]
GASQFVPPVGVTVEPAWGQEPVEQGPQGVHGFPGMTAEARGQATIQLVQQYYAQVLGTLRQLDQELRDPWYLVHQVEQWHQRAELEVTLQTLGQQLQWYFSVEQTPLAQMISLARHMYPNGYTGVPVIGDQGRNVSGTPAGVVPGINFTGFGTHSGYQFSALANSARN